MSFWRATAVWTGPGGPGVSHLDYREEVLLSVQHDDIFTAWRAYFAQLAGYLPNEWSIALQSELEQFSDAGVLEDVQNIATGLASVPGTYTGTWAGAVGVCTRFATDEVVGGKVLRGKTFFVPAGSTVAFDQDGTLNSTALVDFNAARVTLHNAIAVAEGIPVVYSPTYNTTGDIVGWNIADRSAVLRSRRD